MLNLFESIKESYNALWHVKTLGQSLEIVTPMVANNESFVSVFVTKHGDDYVVTDGGWISAGYYECDNYNQGTAYQRLFQYYLENYDIRQTSGHGRIMYYKKVKDHFLVVNAIFELSNFISSVVSGSNIQFQADKKERTFRSSVREYLTNSFEEGTFKFGQKPLPNSSIEFSVTSTFRGHLQLMNVVTGSTAGYYRDSFCRSNFYFEAARRYSDILRINKTIALLDDSTPSVFDSVPVREILSLSKERGDSLLLPWSERERLYEFLVA